MWNIVFLRPCKKRNTFGKTKPRPHCILPELWSTRSADSEHFHRKLCRRSVQKRIRVVSFIFLKWWVWIEHDFWCCWVPFEERWEFELRHCKLWHLRLWHLRGAIIRYNSDESIYKFNPSRRSPQTSKQTLIFKSFKELWQFKYWSCLLNKYSNSILFWKWFNSPELTNNKHNQLVRSHWTSDGLHHHQCSHSWKYILYRKILYRFHWKLPHLWKLRKLLFVFLFGTLRIVYTLHFELLFWSNWTKIGREPFDHPNPKFKSFSFHLFRRRIYMGVHFDRVHWSIGSNRSKLSVGQRGSQAIHRLRYIWLRNFIFRKRW